MDNQAMIRWSGDRYELTIKGQLKAYTQDDHEAGKAQMITMVKEKGYDVHIEGGKDNEESSK
jgi:hypothetical protein